MVMEVDAGMERVLGGFSLRLSDRDDSDGSGGGRGGGHDEADGGSGAVKERIARALRLYKESSGAGEDGGGALVQVWAPARDGERRRVLATRGQPFVLPSRCRRLLQYRTVSLTHVFAVGGGQGRRVTWEERGLPGRVFEARAPEWTPNVQFYGTGEYARMSYALIYDIQASLALPILDPAHPRRCLAVLELVFTAAPAARFAAEAHRLCKALQAVSLRGSEICHPVPPTEICNSEATQAAMSEVSELLAAVREAHELPLAQAWVRCKQCSSTDVEDDNQHFSLTTAGAPFHLGAHYGGFRDACAEHHLRRGQGLVGEAAAVRGPRFCADVARRSKDAYPLAHYARMHGLAGCLAVPLRLPQSAMDVGDDDGQVEEECVVLEFFLPPDCRSAGEQKAMVDAVAATIRKECSGNHLEATSDLQDLSLEAVLADADTAHELNDRGDYDTNDSDEEDGDQAGGVHGADQSGAEDRVPQPEMKKKTGRKAGRPVSLKELQGYFSGSLKDAARSLGVCPTTMKRICRQHGISRWPFRKISKVNRALGKIRAIESADCSPKPTAAASSTSRRAPAPHLPCLSSALGEDTSSQGSSQDPPPLTKTTMRKSLLWRSNGAEGELVTIKANYRGDIIRFRVSCSAGVAAVKEEVAKRLGLDAGAFDVKYLDDDHEWVLLSCDADFQECLDVAPGLPASATMAGGAGVVSPVVRLMVQEVVADNHRSSCGSSD
ncbi:protein NLP3 isoform X2 [Aegilops tauschii subsp. strangulata]|uniref:RWP-RK domain-containing protein n=1 Tax=Aegilops tauschii subsp. strangulata TaxID=200361 RepID=A0A453N803_AEGTS|nr:protein NLP3 isoform X2 [Aegilops tauschii subsp. strangulata]